MRVKYSDVLERMKKSANLKNDSRLARLLGVTPQALSNYKKRSKVPSDLLIKFADMQGLSVDWLLSGEGPSSRVSSAEAEAHGVAEADTTYELRSGMAVASLMNFAGLSPDELIYVGRLVKVLRSADKATAAVLRWTIDAFEKAVSSGSDAPAIAITPCTGDAPKDPDDDSEPEL
jgi:hypothetical protein